MNDMGVKEAVEVLRRIETKMNEVFNEMAPFKSQKDEQMIIEDRQALSRAISELELLNRVEEGGIKADNPSIVVIAPDCVWIVEHNQKVIDLCNAHWVKKLEGVKKLIPKVYCDVPIDTIRVDCYRKGKGDKYLLKQENGNDLAQSIISHLTGGKG